MAIHVKGVMHGTRIELESDPGLPDGVSVDVTIAGALSAEEKEHLIHELCGAWSDDPSLEGLFDEIISDRLKSQPRIADFDAAS
ncbi:MAG: hypothetical protein ACHQ50_11570 [Fimbriimonadales bacterium]